MCKRIAKRLGWLLLIWCCGVLVVLIISTLVRGFMTLTGLHV
ncbi:DUF2474 family protein [Klebsiella aerogenes]